MRTVTESVGPSSTPLANLRPAPPAFSAPAPAPAPASSPLPRYAKSGNQAYCAALAEWALQQRSKLRISNVVHHLAGHSVAANPKIYRIRDNIVRCSIAVSFGLA